MMGNTEIVSLRGVDGDLVALVDRRTGLAAQINEHERRSGVASSHRPRFDATRARPDPERHRGRRQA
jgi:hypothetical protein